MSLTSLAPSLTQIILTTSPSPAILIAWKSALVQQLREGNCSLVANIVETAGKVPTKPLIPDEPPTYSDSSASILAQMYNITMADPSAPSLVEKASVLLLLSTKKNEYKVFKEEYDTMKKEYDEFRAQNRNAVGIIRRLISDASHQLAVVNDTVGTAVHAANDGVGIFLSIIRTHNVVADKSLISSYVDTQKTIIAAVVQGDRSVEDYILDYDNECKILADLDAASRISEADKLLHLWKHLNSSWDLYKSTIDMVDARSTTYPDLCKVLKKADGKKKAQFVSDSVKSKHESDSTGHSTSAAYTGAPCVWHTLLHSSAASSHPTENCIQLQKMAAELLENRKEKSATSGDKITGPSTSKPKKKFKKQVHSTTLETSVEKDKGSDDESLVEDIRRFLKSTTNHATVVSHNFDDKAGVTDDEPTCPRVNAFSTSSQALQDHLFFDTLADGIILNNSAFAYNVGSNIGTTRISGSTPGSISTRLHGNLGIFGIAAIHRDVTKNLIPQCVFEDCGYSVDFHNVSKEYRMTKAQHPTVVFKKYIDKFYSIKLSEFRHLFPEHYNSISASNSETTPIFFSNEERARAELAKVAHETWLYHLHPDKMKANLSNGAWSEAGFTARDIDNIPLIHGTKNWCKGCLKCKGTRPAKASSYTDHPTDPGQKLVGDLFFVLGYVFLLLTCRLTAFRTVTRLTGKSKASLRRGLDSAVITWHSLGTKPTDLSFDSEPSVKALIQELKVKHKLSVTCLPADTKEATAERSNRTLKEPVYCSLSNLKIEPFQQLVAGIVIDTTTMLNDSPNVHTAPLTARQALGTSALNIKKWSRFYAGQHCMVYKPYNAKSDHAEGERWEEGVILNHVGYYPNVMLFPYAGHKARTEVVRDRRVKILEWTPSSIALVNSFSTKQDQAVFHQEMNDYFSDIAEELVRSTDADPTDDVSVMSRSTVEPSLDVASLVGNDARSQPAPAPAEPERELEPVATVAPLSAPALLVSTTPLVSSPLRISSVPTVVTDFASAGPSTNVMTPTSSETIPMATLPPERPTLASPVPIRTSGRSNAVKPPGYYKSMHTGSHATNTAPPGKNLTHAQAAGFTDAETADDAGATEIRNILDRQTVYPRNPRKLSALDISSAIPSFMFYSLKDKTPDELDADQVIRSKKEALEARLRLEKHNGDWDIRLTRAERELLKKKLHKWKVRARWVGGGNHQKKVDKSVVSAPTARAASHNILFTIIAHEKRDFCVGDVPSAYLQTKNESLDGKPVLIRMDRKTTALAIMAKPDLANYVMKDGCMICEVNMALYGLVLSAWLWYEEVTSTLTDIGYTITDSDRGVVTKTVGTDNLTATIHVDDIATGSHSTTGGTALKDEFWSTLEAKYKGIKLQKGPHYKHLGCDITYDQKTGLLDKSHRNYLAKLLDGQGIRGKETLPCRLDLMGPKQHTTPVSAKEHAAFRSVLQAVAYIDTLPQIALTVSYLQRQTNAPVLQDLHDLVHLLRYLNNNRDAHLRFCPKDLQLRAASDAAFASHYDQRTHIGFYYTLGGEHCAPIEYSSGTLKQILRSSTEGEMGGVNAVVSPLLWARDLLLDLGYAQQPIPIQQDNKSAITLMQGARKNFQSASKHIRIKWSFFRQQRKLERVFLEYCHTALLHADLLTKPLGGRPFKQHTDAISGMLPAQ